MDTGLLLLFCLIAAVVALVVLRPIIRHKTWQAIADAPAKQERVRAAAAETLGTALAFADPVGGRSVTGRALEGAKLVTPLADDVWRVGGPMHIGGVEAEWTTDAGRGILRATRTVTLVDTLVGGENWQRALTAVEQLAVREGIAVERVAGIFVDSGQTAGTGRVWVRARS